MHTTLLKSTQTAILTALLVACIGATAVAQPIDLVRDGDFERSDLTLGARDEPGVWVVRSHGATQATVAIVVDPAGQGGRCLEYRNTGEGSHNFHVDQLVRVTPETVYELRARVRGDGKLEPLIAVQTKAWANLATVSCGTARQWSDVRLLFQAYDNDVVRLEWFPGAEGRLHSGVAGTSWLDDLRIRPVANPGPSLVRSFALQRPQPDRENDLRQVRVGAIGNPRPLRRVAARDGVLVYEDGTEVALWGVNLQTALSWEYNGRLKPLGIAHTAEALQEISTRNLDQLPLLEAGVVRMHLLPADFSGPDGELRDTVYLDVLDDLLAQCCRRGIYVYLTLMNEMNGNYCTDSFVAGHERVEWVFDPALAARSERYVREFLERTNRYTGLRYADDPTIAVVEILNEPRYPTWQELRTDASLRTCADAFEAWRATQPGDMPADSLYPAYRYEHLLGYLNRMCAVVRGTGCPAPVVWNLNWPRMVSNHEDVFQATADSDVDAVSFCCYPGQSDVANPFWAHPADLSGNNYLPYLQQCYGDYTYLRWMLGQRFAKKAKLAYEFESMYNHSAHLYPAMARLFRALGAQIAPMWQYTLSPVAEYRAGSHYLNVYCTPRKAVSFRIAARVFAATPRYAPFDMAATTEMTGPQWAVSFDHDLCLWSDEGAFLNSGQVDWNPLHVPESPGLIVGCASSPLVTYDGTGMYVLEFAGERADLRILPDVHYTYPPWQPRGSRSPQRVCELNSEAEHVFELHCAGWTTGVEITRVDGDRVTRISRDDPGTRFRATPGHYQLTRRAK